MNDKTTRAWIQRAEDDLQTGKYSEEPELPDREGTQRAIELAERVRAFVRDKFAELGLTLQE
jgi:HEPN domain-containing protein